MTKQKTLCSLLLDDKFMKILTDTIKRLDNYMEELEEQKIK